MIARSHLVSEGPAGFNARLRAWADQEHIDDEDDAVWVMTNRLV